MTPEQARQANELAANIERTQDQLWKIQHEIHESRYKTSIVIGPQGAGRGMLTERDERDQDAVRVIMLTVEMYLKQKLQTLRAELEAV